MLVFGIWGRSLNPDFMFYEKLQLGLMEFFVLTKEIPSSQRGEGKRLKRDVFRVMQ